MVGKKCGRGGRGGSGDGGDAGGLAEDPGGPGLDGAAAVYDGNPRFCCQRPAEFGGFAGDTANDAEGGTGAAKGNGTGFLDRVVEIIDGNDGAGAGDRDLAGVVHPAREHHREIHICRAVPGVVIFLFSLSGVAVVVPADWPSVSPYARGEELASLG